MFVIAVLASIGIGATRMLTKESPASTPFVGAVIAVVGLIAIGWVYFGGMIGVTRMLALKVVLFSALVLVMTILVLAKYKMNMFHLLDDAQANAAPNKNGFSLLEPGRLFGKLSSPNANTSPQDPWVHLSKTFSVAAGVIAMPFLFTRFLVAGSGKEAQRSSGYAAMIAVTFWNAMIILGLGATAILGGKVIGSKWDTRDITLPLLADNLGGKFMGGALGGVAMLSTAALFAVLLLNGVTSYVKDLNAMRGRVLEPAEELRVIRRNVLVIGVISLVVGTVLVPLLTHLFIPSSIDVGATCVLPAIVYTLFWKRFNTSGLKWTVYGGLAAVAFMVVFSNGVSGDPTAAIFPDIDFRFIDFEPGLIGAPLGFLLGYIGTVISKERNDAGFAEMQVRALTGAVLPARSGKPAPAGSKQDTGTVNAR
jgi:cation/acetate symporter